MKFKKAGNHIVKLLFNDSGQTAKQAFTDLILQKAHGEGFSSDNNFPNFPVDLEKGSVYNESKAFSDIRAQQEGETL